MNQHLQNSTALWCNKEWNISAAAVSIWKTEIYYGRKHEIFQWNFYQKHIIAVCLCFMFIRGSRQLSIFQRES